MASDWKKPSADDVKTYMSSVVVDRAIRTDDDQQIIKLLAFVVARIRGSINPPNVISDDESEVPPEAWQHAVVLTAAALMASQPNFNFLVKGEGGTTSLFGMMVQAAEKWIERADMNELKAITYPTNPQTSKATLVRWKSDALVATTSV